MVSENLEKAIGRSIFDDNFRSKWLRDFENQSDELDIADVRERIKAEHFLRDFEKYKTEKENGKKEVNQTGYSQNIANKNNNNNKNPSIVIPERIDEKLNRSNSSSITSSSDSLNQDKEHLDLSKRMNDYVFTIFQNSIDDSRRFLNKIFYISYGIFGGGIGFFILSFLSGSGLMGNELGVSLTVTFGLLGILNFIAYFIFNPSKQIQLEISNLLKLEMIYMNFWDQLNFWRPFGNSNDEDKKREASERLHSAAKTSIELLQQYLEEKKGTGSTKNILDKINKTTVSRKKENPDALSSAPQFSSDTTSAPISKSSDSSPVNIKTDANNTYQNERKEQ